MFADKECTKRPSGTPKVIYAKVNRVFGYGCETLWGTWADFPRFCFIFTPMPGSPEDNFQIRALGNFLSDELQTAIVPGVYRLVNWLQNVEVHNLPFGWGDLVPV